MPELPSGTVTFLFTDIEGSTRLWEAFPDDMGTALRLHDRLVTDAVARHGGRVVKHTGDGIFAAFPAPGDAVAAAIDAQTALVAADWPEVVGALGVRMALHTATVDPVDGDYRGADVNRVARIEAAAHGGQILLSSATKTLVERSLPAGAEIVELGSFLLRGLADPEPIHQVVAPGLRREFPPLRTAAALQPRLPDFTTSFVGRRQEIDALTRVLTDGETRLVTLMGPGGIGKTRLAVEVARAVSTLTGRPAHFFAAQHLGVDADLVRELGTSIGFEFDGHLASAVPEETQLFERLAAQPLLLVFDNLEHLSQAPRFLSRLLGAVPTVTVLATSRQALGLAAEWRYTVGGLDDYGTDDSAVLFCARAARVGARLDPDADGVADLCAALGGMPLAIELAAGWADTLTPAEIAAEVRRGLEILETEAEDVPSRHRSIRAVFDQTWRLLPDDLQAVFPRLSVFAAPFDREAAAAVAGASIADLKRLTARALLTRPTLGHFGMHPLVAEFAAGRLGEDERADLLERYARYYWHFLLDRRDAFRGRPDLLAVVADTAAEYGHLRAAAEVWVERFPDSEVAEGLIVLNDYSFSAGSGNEHRVLYQRLAARYRDLHPPSVLHELDGYLLVQLTLALELASSGGVDQTAALLADVADACRRRGGLFEAVWLLVKGVEESMRGDHRKAIAALEAARTRDGDLYPLLRAILRTWLGWSHLEAGHVDRARDIFAEGLDIAAAISHPVAQAYLLSKAGLAADAAGELDLAVELHEQGREFFAKVGHLGGEAYTLSRLSWTYYLKGDYETARRYAVDALERFEDINLSFGKAVACGRLGLAEVELGRFVDAADHFLTCLDLAAAGGYVAQCHYAVIGIGRALLAAGHTREAASLLRHELGDDNPYRQFAAEAWERIPAEERDGGEELSFELLCGRARRAARTLLCA